MYKVHNTINSEHGQKSMSYIVVDTEREKMVCAGEEEITNANTAQFHRKKAMRSGLSHAALVVDKNSTIEVYDHGIPNSSLIMGRLTNEVRTMIERKGLSVRFSSHDDCVDKVTLGFSRMSRISSNPFSTAVSKPDYEVKNPVTIYSDGSYRGDNDGQTAIGYALIDDAGTLIGLGSHSIPPTISSLEAEYEAVRAGVNKASKYDDITNLQLVTDNRRVARTLAGEKDPLPRNKTLTTQINEVLNSFLAVSVTHKNRDENLLADALANYGHERNLVGAI